jgi:hypothetical protein
MQNIRHARRENAGARENTGKHVSPLHLSFFYVYSRIKLPWIWISERLRLIRGCGRRLLC